MDWLLCHRTHLPFKLLICCTIFRLIFPSFFLFDLYVNNLNSSKTSLTQRYFSINTSLTTASRAPESTWCTTDSSPAACFRCISTSVRPYLLWSLCSFSSCSSHLARIHCVPYYLVCFCWPLFPFLLSLFSLLCLFLLSLVTLPTKDFSNYCSELPKPEDRISSHICIAPRIYLLRW